MNSIQFSQRNSNNYEWMNSSIKQNICTPNNNNLSPINLNEVYKKSFSISSSITNSCIAQQDKMYLKQKIPFWNNDLRSSNDYFLKNNIAKNMTQSCNYQSKLKEQTLQNRVFQLEKIIKIHQEILQRYKNSFQYKQNSSSPKQKFDVLGDITGKIINNTIIHTNNQKIDLQNDSFEEQIKQIKRQMKKMIQKDQVQNQFQKLQAAIKQIMSSFKKCFLDQINSLHKKYDKIKKKILSQNSHSTFQESLNLIKKQFQKDLQAKISKLLCQKVVPSEEKFKGNAILLKVKQQLFYTKSVSFTPQLSAYNFSSFQPFVSKQESNFEKKELEVQKSHAKMDKIENGTTQTIYYLDSQCYLLDNQNFYLLFEGQKIKLSQQQINTLKKSGVML